ncbi:MAG: hypothetical protein QF917_04170 [Candidatus Woesearchaeota archaeon]|nr:hypothetical protein [Candidatus Woesearchaeota archaeon]
MKLSNDSKELVIFLSIIAVVIAIFSFALFGITGVRVFIGIVFMSLPFYLLLDNFKLTPGEKFVFSVILGITILPSLAFILGFVISFRLAILVIFIVLVIAAVALRKYKKN